ncbi:MAG: flagellar hook-basal body complex protein FliE [Clostridiales bacterium]|nr:flagellar hook-basal body complex protein FliE [Clostridiales bacterium]
MFIVPIEPMKLMEFSESGNPRREPARESGFKNVLSNAVAALEETQRASQYDAYQLALGNVDDMSEIMINTLKAESMIQTTVQITTRVIAAYKEIMNIQI